MISSTVAWLAMGIIPDFDFLYVMLCRRRKQSGPVLQPETSDQGAAAGGFDNPTGKNLPLARQLLGVKAWPVKMWWNLLTRTLKSRFSRAPSRCWWTSGPNGASRAGC